MTVLTNRVSNPHAGVDRNGYQAEQWTGSSTTTRVATGGPDGGSFARATWLTAQADMRSGISYSAVFADPGLAVSPGESLSVRLQVRTSIAQRMTVYVVYLNAASGVVLSTNATPVVTVANTWTPLVLDPVFVAPALTTRAYIMVSSITGTGAVTWPVNSTLDVALLSANKGSSAQPYFDGDTEDVPGWITYDWTGTAHNSTSTALMSLVSIISYLATRIASEIMLRGIPVGGTAGEVLAKTSGTDFTTAWTTPLALGSTAGTAADADAVATALAALLPAGCTLPYAGSSAPAGFLLCNGASVLRASYAVLFTAIGTTFGTVDGTHFTLPDLRGRVPGGYDSTQTEFNALGKTGGEKTHIISASEMPTHSHIQNAHNHSQNAHGHSFNADATWPRIWGTDVAEQGFVRTVAAAGSSYGVVGVPSGNFSALGAGHYTIGSAIASNNSTTATNQNTGGGTAHNNLQPYISLNYIIKT